MKRLPELQCETRMAAEILLEVEQDKAAGTYTATSPNLSGLVAEAKSESELLDAVADCVELLLLPITELEE